MEMKIQYWWDISQEALTGHVSRFHLKIWDFLGGAGQVKQSTFTLYSPFSEHIKAVSLSRTLTIAWTLR